MQNTYLRLREHSDQSSKPYRDYTWAMCRSISNDYGGTRWFKYDDTIMLPLLGSEKSSAVHIISVSNGSNPLVRFPVRVGTGTEPLQWVLLHENPDCCNWAGFTTKNLAFQLNNLGSN